MNRRDFLKTLGVGAIAVQLPGMLKKNEQVVQSLPSLEQYLKKEFARA